MNFSKRGNIPAVVRDLIILAGSVLLVVIFTKFNPNMFFSDDNAMQWEVVIQEVFDGLFSDGYISYRNIYQYKGIDIFSSGYYGQTNIFMLISYLISRFVFRGSIHIVSVYIPMLYGLGNIFMTRLLLDCLNIRKSVVFAMITMYSCVTIFFSYSIYYFTFNSYFFVPFLLWVFLKTQNNKLKWFAPGLILSFGLYLGHAQYAFYYVIIYAIKMISLSIMHRDIKEIGVAAANAAVYLALSGMFLLCMFGASAERSMIFDKTDFFSDPLKVKHFLAPVNALAYFDGTMPFDEFRGIKDVINCGFIGLLFFLLFAPIWKRAISLFDVFFGNGKESGGNPIIDKFKTRKELVIVRKMLFSVICVAMAYFICHSLFSKTTAAWTATLASYLALLGFMFIFPDSSERKLPIMRNIMYALIIGFSMFQPFGFIAVFLLSVVVRSISKKKKTHKKYGHNADIIYSISAAAIFFLLLSFGKQTPIAHIMYRIPIINGFRFLYKCVFLIIPLMIPAAAYTFEKYVYPKLKKPSIAILYCSAALQALCTCIIFWGGNIDLLNGDHYNFKDHDHFLDRSQALFEEKIPDSSDYRFLACANEERTDETNVILSCIYECQYKYTKNYATPNGIFSLGGYDNVFTMESFRQSDEIISDIINEGNMCNAVCDFDRFDDISESSYRKQRFEDQMIENGVKYVLFTKSDTEFIDSFERLIDMCPRLSVADRFDGLEDVWILSLDGVKPICSDTADNSRISISPKLSELTFGADGAAKTVKISLTFDSGYRMTLNGKDIPLFRTDDGYITADIPAENGEVRLYYENRLMDTVMLAAIITTVLSAALTVICLCRRSSECRTDISSIDEGIS